MIVIYKYKEILTIHLNTEKNPITISIHSTFFRKIEKYMTEPFKINDLEGEKRF